MPAVADGGGVILPPPVAVPAARPRSQKSSHEARPPYDRLAMRRLVTTLLIALSAASAVAATGPSEWPQFRGRSGSGVADESSLPERWSRTENVAWSIDVPGRGWSSPIVWRDLRLRHVGDLARRVQGALHRHLRQRLRRRTVQARTVRRGSRQARRQQGHRADRRNRRHPLHGLRARYPKTGAIRWEREAHRGKPFGGRHRKNTYASETPVTDGERLYVSFGGNVGVFCYSMDGTLLWKHSWPPQPIYLDFGTASSPVVHGGRLYQLHDNDGASFLAALDARTGARALDGQTRREGADDLGMGDAVHLGQRDADRSRHDRPRPRRQLRPRRHASCGAWAG